MNTFITINTSSPYYRNWLRFKNNRRGYISLWVFMVLFILSLFAEVLSNDKPLIIHFNDGYYFPVIKEYSETFFGGDFDTEADYNDPYVRKLLSEGNNWALYPLNPYSYDTINYFTKHPNPAPPSADNLLGTDDHGRDVLARLIYGFRLSVIFALGLTLLGIIMGVVAGAIQG
ncbi:MAG: ABC transporter permease, partial [Gammaproteobacteria bacterium]|nr:ABC transporter permease [Gammaproteobacteria bacterium]